MHMSRSLSGLPNFRSSQELTALSETLSPLRNSRELSCEQLDAEVEEMGVDADDDDQRKEIYYWRENLEQWLDGILVQVRGLRSN